MTKDGLIYTIQLKKKNPESTKTRWCSSVGFLRGTEKALKINGATCRHIMGKKHLKKNSIFKESQSAAKQ